MTRPIAPPAAPVAQEFRYEITWPATGNRPGHHRSRRSGSGFEFREHAPLAADPNPRRLDLYASTRDPQGELKVRILQERRSITMYVLADLSASMAFSGRADRRKLAVLTEFSAAAAVSAYRTGDAFGFFGASNAVRDDLRFPPSRAKGLGPAIAARLRECVPSGDSASGLIAAAEQLGRHRALVFLASDFHFPLSQIEALLTALGRHRVVPVVLWDPAEYDIQSGWGIASVRDLESGRRRVLFLRPALQAKIRRAFKDRQQALQELFLRHDAPPLTFLHGFDPDRVTQYFTGVYVWPALGL